MSINSSTHYFAEDTIRSLHRVNERWGGDSGGKIVAVASIAEALADRFIDLLVFESGADATPLGKYLLSENKDSFHRTWADRNAILKRGFGIQVAGKPEWQNMKVVVEVRNAVVHGDGDLTEKQLGDPYAVIRLRGQVEKLLRSEIQGNRIRLSNIAGNLSTCIAIKYVMALDAAISSVRGGANIGTIETSA